MASVLQNGFGSLSGTCSSAAPATILDLQPGGGGAAGLLGGADGVPVNAINIVNLDITGIYFMAVVIGGINTTATPFMIPPQALGVNDKCFQVGVQSNGIQSVLGWACDISGNTFSGSVKFCGGPMIKR